MLRLLCLSLLLVSSCVLPRGKHKTCKTQNNASSGAASVAPGLSLHTTLKNTTWPMDEKNGTYPIRVCWNDMNLGDRVFSRKEFAPNIPVLFPIRKDWIRVAVEKEWNTRTNLRFIGWKSCKDEPAADIILQPISSAVTPGACGYRGQSCVATIGKNDGRENSKIVFLNMTFGDEFLYVSQFMQASSLILKWDPKEALDSWWVPGACYKEFRTAWSTINGSAAPEYRIDINRLANMSRYATLYKSCLQVSALHEFGHIAGFLHEQLRKDPSATEDQYQACLNYISKNNIGSDQDKARANAPVGMVLSPFDKESIMSYCRENEGPTLSDLDVKGTLVAYPGKNGVFTSWNAEANGGKNALGSAKGEKSSTASSGSEDCK